MASKATSLEDEVEDGAWIKNHYMPRTDYKTLTRGEGLELLRQVKSGTKTLKLDARKYGCSFNNGKIIINSSISKKIKQNLDNLALREYISGYDVIGNNGTSVIEIGKIEENGYSVRKSAIALTLSFRKAAAKIARDRLMLGNRPLVISRAKLKAKKYGLNGSYLGDLIQDGQFGLERAIDGYNPERKREFSTYATWAIDREIERAVLKDYKMINLSRPRVSSVSAIEKCAHENEIGFLEACSKMKLHPETIKSSLCARDAMRLVSFSTPVFDGKEELGNIIPSPETSAGEDYEKSSMLDYVRKLVDRLPWKQRQVIVVSYFCRERPPLREIGNYLGVSSERARQIRASAIKKLRKYAGVDEHKNEY